MAPYRSGQVMLLRIESKPVDRCLTKRSLETTLSGDIYAIRDSCLRTTISKIYLAELGKRTHASKKDAREERGFRTGL